MTVLPRLMRSWSGNRAPAVKLSQTLALLVSFLKDVFFEGNASHFDFVGEKKTHFGKFPQKNVFPMTILS